MRVVFMGTPEFAVYSLDAVIERGDEVALVVSQQDRPKDRGKKMQPTAVKKRAKELGLPVFQPENIKSDETFELLKEIEPDIIVVTAYGQILPRRILELTKYGCVNVHASLLPKYRGAAPIQFAIINGEQKTGITTMYMSEGLDTGDMILKDEIEILPDDTSAILHDKLALLSKKTLTKTLDKIEQQIAPRIAQQEELSSYAPLISKQMGHIDFSKEAESVVNLVRGLPTYAYLDEHLIKLFDARLGESTDSEDYGKIIRLHKDSIEVIAKGHSVLFYEIQVPNKKRMRVADFLKGNSLETGAVFQ
ncbi:MAG: methionyl-tRNA formyltransferase [Peptostreptococcaceae bacterium]|nr:methionyl-tRNA formyltransferase [Peptostreptococcaceae bacterium]